MKKTILFTSLLAVFLMLMIPNISAVEYQTINGTYNQKSDTIQRMLDFLANTTEFSNTISNFIVILYEILQGFFLISMFMLSTMVLDSSDNRFIAFILYYGLAVLSGFISSKCDIFMTDHFDLTTIQELIIDYGGYLMIILYILINNYSNEIDNFTSEH